MSEQPTPNFAEILGPAIASVPEPARPNLLAQLERGAAGRYRLWAAEDSGAAGELEACAKREEQIADRIDALFPLAPAHEREIRKAVPVAGRAFFGLFEGLSAREQWRLQAQAERAGAAAWRLLASQQDDPEARAALEVCAQWEEQSAAVLEKLVSG